MVYKTNLNSLKDAYNESMGNIWGTGMKVKAKLDVGNNFFRFAPQHPNMQLLFLQVKVHSFVGGVKTNHCFCPIDSRGSCPICERGQELLNQGVPEADKLQPQRKFLYNAVYLGNGTWQHQETIEKILKEGLIQLLLGIQVHNNLIKGMVYGGVGDITDIQTGCTANIFREGTEWNNTKYSFFPLQAKPVPQELVKLVSNPPDLSNVIQFHEDENLIRMLAGQSVFFPAEMETLRQTQSPRTPVRTPSTTNPEEVNGQGNTVNTTVSSPF